MTNLKPYALTALLIAIGWALLPFAHGIAWSIVLASVVWPVAQKVHGRHRGVMAAGLTLGVLALMVVPLVMLVIEAVHAWHLLLPWYQQEAAKGWPAPDVVAGHAQALAVWHKASDALPTALGSHAQEWAQKVLGRSEEMLINGLVALLLLWTFLRSGTVVTQATQEFVTRRLGELAWDAMVRATITLRVTFMGLALTAAGETLLFIAVFGFAGLPHALSFGALAGVTSVIPGLTPVVFLVAAIWLALQHAMVAAIAVALLGTIIVGVADHFVKPVFIGKASGLPMALTLLSMLAGLLAMGVVGLFVGPAAAAGTLRLMEPRLNSRSDTQDII